MAKSTAMAAGVANQGKPNTLTHHHGNKKKVKTHQLNVNKTGGFPLGGGGKKRRGRA